MNKTSNRFVWIDYHCLQKFINLDNFFLIKDNIQFVLFFKNLCQYVHQNYNKKDQYLDFKTVYS